MSFNCFGEFRFYEVLNSTVVSERKNCLEYRLMIKEPSGTKSKLLCLKGGEETNIRSIWVLNKDGNQVLDMKNIYTITSPIIEVQDVVEVNTADYNLDFKTVALVKIISPILAGSCVINGLAIIPLGDFKKHWSESISSDTVEKAIRSLQPSCS